MIIRQALTIGILIVYLVLFNYYIYELTLPDMPIECKKLFYNYITLGMVVFTFADIKAGFVSYLHEQFNNICILSVVINFILIILTHHTILQNPIPMFFAFNGSVFAVTVMIGFSIIRHGYKD